jgi:hypothetical protein
MCGLSVLAGIESFVDAGADFEVAPRISGATSKLQNKQSPVISLFNTFSPG